jgi:DHA2 family multidrug resistance protein-like MFS transporter
MAGGLALAAVGFVAASRVLGLGVEAIIVASTTYSLGMSFVFTLGIDAIISAAPAERAGAAAAISETGSELGGALGIAVLGSIAMATYRGHLSHAALTAVPPEAQRVALDSLGGAVATATRLRSDGAGVLLEAARIAYTHALQVTLALCAAVALVSAVVAATMLRRPSVRDVTMRPLEGRRGKPAGSSTDRRVISLTDRRRTSFGHSRQNAPADHQAEEGGAP